MTGALNMGTKKINNVSAIRTTDNIIVGTNAVVTGLGSTSNVLLGDYSTATGAYGVGLGFQATARNISIAIGKEHGGCWRHSGGLSKQLWRSPGHDRDRAR